MNGYNYAFDVYERTYDFISRVIDELDGRIKTDFLKEWLAHLYSNEVKYILAEVDGYLAALFDLEIINKTEYQSFFDENYSIRSTDYELKKKKAKK